MFMSRLAENEIIIIVPLSIVVVPRDDVRTYRRSTTTNDNQIISVGELQASDDVLSLAMRFNLAFSLSKSMVCCLRGAWRISPFSHLAAVPIVRK